MSTNCFHCGLPIIGESPWHANINGQQQAMCCPACATVAETIAGSGLSDFYRFRDQSTPNSQPSESESYAIYDDPELQRDFVETHSNSALARFLVEDIHCAACAWLIEKAIGNSPAVNAVRVLLNDKIVSVEFDPQELTVSRLMRELNRIGYRPAPYHPDRARAAAKAENRRFLMRLGIAGIGMMQVGMFAIGLHAGAIDGIDEEFRQLLRFVSLLVATPVVFYSAQSFFQNAWINLRNRSLGMDVPVATAIGIAYLASVFATIRGVGEVYFDSVVMFTFLLLLGRYMEMKARHRLGDPATALRNLLPRACIKMDGSEQQQVPLERIRPGDTVLVKPGTVIPADGVVVDGSSAVDESTFTGETDAVRKNLGDSVHAGTSNGESPLQIRVESEFQQSKLQSVFSLLEQAQQTKPRIAQFVDSLASRFVSTVLFLSAATACYWYFVDPSKAFWVALSVLVVSCPCALSLATPTAITAAVSRMREIGILVVSSRSMETIPDINRIVFDKTGTLTFGHLNIEHTEVFLPDLDEHQALDIAAAVEAYSEHPIAKAFKEASRGKASTRQVSELQQHSGLGISAKVDGEPVLIGSWNLVGCDGEKQPQANPRNNSHQSWRRVYLRVNKRLAAVFEMSDQLRPSAGPCVTEFAQRGLSLTVLSGDSQESTAATAELLGIEEALGGQLPGDKMTHTQNMQRRGNRVMMVGDGINDIVALAGADLSVAMGDASELTKTNADCIMTSSNLLTLNTGFEVARLCKRIIRQNIAWALMYNGLAIPLAMMGWIPPYLAAIGMSLSSLIVVMNAWRLKHVELLSNTPITS